MHSYRVNEILILTEMKIMAWPEFWGFKWAKVGGTISINTFHSNSFSGFQNVVLF